MAEARKPWEHAKSGGSETDAFAQRFVESLSYDRRLYQHDVAGSIAHARMLRHVDLITADDLSAIEGGLKQIESEIEQQGDAWPGWKVELEDVHMCIEAALIEKIGEPGKKLHTGRSRNDQVALDLKLWIEEAAEQLEHKFDALFRAFIELAQRDGRIVMPSYTHLQRAQPIVAGGELLAWLSAFDRCLARFMMLVPVDSANPLGSGAIAGSSLPLDRQHVAEALCVGEPSPNSIDATASRDAAIDFVYALAMTSMSLSRWAEQWIIYMTAEFGFVSIGEAYTTGSSMMPQKRNPDMLELIRGRCGGVYGQLMALMSICAGQPIGYNRDMQEDKRHVFAAYDTVHDCLEMATRIVRSAKFNEDRIRQSLDKGFLDATSLAEYFVTKGIPFRTAHQYVGAIVQMCEQKGVTALRDLAVSDMQSICDAIGDDVAGWLGAENVVARYQTEGNAGLSGFAEQLTAWEKRLGAASPAQSGGADPDSRLFNDGDDPDAALIDVYQQQHRTLDDLPYTEEFEAIAAAAGGDDRAALFHRLHNIRKAGRLPKVGRAKGRAPAVTDDQAQALSALVVEAIGELSKRDQLPYTAAFDRIVVAFNTQAGLSFDPHQVWRVVAKLAK